MRGTRKNGLRVDTSKTGTVPAWGLSQAFATRATVFS